VFDTIKTINQGFARKFPPGNEPYQIMTRLLEEGGELAQQVNHFENSGVKRKKHGQPDRAKLADEVKGVLITVFQLVEYYELQAELQASLEYTQDRLRNDGFLER
jgi:NTP pyrophosphatase (non-canonical NTP hydrolase)